MEAVQRMMRPYHAPHDGRNDDIDRQFTESQHMPMPMSEHQFLDSQHMPGSFVQDERSSDACF